MSLTGHEITFLTRNAPIKDKSVSLVQQNKTPQRKRIIETGQKVVIHMERKNQIIKYKN